MARKISGEDCLKQDSSTPHIPGRRPYQSTGLRLVAQTLTRVSPPPRAQRRNFTDTQTGGRTRFIEKNSFHRQSFPAEPNAGDLIPPPQATAGTGVLRFSTRPSF